MLSRIILAAAISFVSIATLVPSVTAETVSQCRARAYRYYDHLVDTGTSESEAKRILAGDLRRCNSR